MVLTESRKYHGFYQLLSKNGPLILLRKNRLIALPIKTENISFFERSEGAIVIEEIDQPVEEYTFDCQNFFMVANLDFSTSPEKVAQKSIFAKP
jgi:hypothetical protein